MVKFEHCFPSKIVFYKISNKYFVALNNVVSILENEIFNSSQLCNLIYSGISTDLYIERTLMSLACEVGPVQKVWVFDKQS